MPSSPRSTTKTSAGTPQVVAIVIVAVIAAAALVVATLALATNDGGSPPHDAAGRDPVGKAMPAQAVERQLVDVVRRVSPEVVQVQTSVGLGSGIVFDAEGHVVTNAHVVGDARRVVVTLAGGQRFPATVVGIEPGHDLAVLHLAGATPRPASFAPSSRVAVGDVVLAIGNPLGLRSSVTEGIVSSVARQVTEGNGVTLAPVLQTSADINPGNSGGALVDLNGQVIGIPTLVALDPDSTTPDPQVAAPDLQAGGSQAPGIGFAIPSDTVRTVVARLLAADRHG